MLLQHPPGGTDSDARCWPGPGPLHRSVHHCSPPPAPVGVLVGGGGGLGDGVLVVVGVGGAGVHIR